LLIITLVNVRQVSAIADNTLIHIICYYVCPSSFLSHFPCRTRCIYLLCV